MTGDLPPLAAWGAEGLALTPLPGGHRNLVLRGQGGGRDLVFKTTRRDEAALRWLGPVQDAARAAGLRAPGLIASAAGHLRVEGWTCEPWLPGVPAEAADLARIAPLVDRFHRNARPLPQRPGFVAAAEAGPRTAAGDLDLPAMPGDLAAACLRAWAPLAGQPMTALHGDLGPGNILMTVDGPALIDWDEARRDAPLFDLAALMQADDAVAARACLAWEVAVCWHVEPARARRLARGLRAG
ncbi:phosphotransferase [Frigidibacter oleivorans]|uniref:phosphotransferase n=1 Tax=Frigidibacter oleivorans TaxID=2487129 RepID=UPI0013DF872D|nr:phosphotransferase [Frigidibacter oleivorans]